MNTNKPKIKIDICFPRYIQELLYYQYCYREGMEYMFGNSSKYILDSSYKTVSLDYFWGLSKS